MISKRLIPIAIATVVFAVVCAAAVLATPTEPPGQPREEVPTEVILDTTGPGHGVSGFIGPAGVPSNPAVAYPPPTTGYTPLNEGFAGVILTSPPGPTGPTLQMYCIDILTPTGPGYGYNLEHVGRGQRHQRRFRRDPAQQLLPERPTVAGDRFAGHREHRRSSGRRASGHLVLLRQLRPGSR